MGFFSGLDTEPYDRQYSDRVLVIRIIQYFRPHIKQMAWIGFYLLLIAVAGASVPLLVSYAVDLVGGDITTREIMWVSLFVVSAGSLVWLANWFRRRLTVQAIGNVVLAIRTDAFQAAAAHDLSFYDEFSSGKIVSRITSDSRDFGQMVTLITDLISQVAQALFVGIALAIVEWKLMLYLLGFLPVVFIIALSFRKMARKVTRHGMRAMANVNAAIKETISGISVSKNFRQEETIFKDFNEANLSSYRVNLKRGFVLSLVFPTLNTVAYFGTAFILYIGGLNVAESVISAGAWYLFLQGLFYFWFPVLNLSAFWAQLQSGLSAAERSFALIDAEPSVVQINHTDVPILKGEIRFNKVCFQYTEQEHILEDFDLHIHPGENVALVGHTGAGKSSLAKLVARFYEFQEGSLTIDGLDIRNLDLAKYRRQLGIVSQMPFLFSETLSQNIRYAQPEISDEEIETLAKRIGDGEWLETLPQGLQTEAGERGGSLSMGQRQLVSLLRVLVQRPAIFILDEATASIDPFTEWQIQQALNLILENTTSILIAHRLSTVKAADRIIVLEQGKIIEEGDHKSLLEQEGHYASLYNTYFRHQSLAYVEQARELSEGD
ncbi:MAG: ABC transporter ATP-binding protein [Chloroflexi bacterium]|nr:ABC transporter ATP-binding protein [Chloroflexota bacterium]